MDSTSAAADLLRPSSSPNAVSLTSQIVAAYVRNNTVATSELPVLIASVFTALRQTTAPADKMPEADKLIPAVPVKKSVTLEYIICLEDGKKLKMLKRHLMSAYNMTPDQYRAKWGLPVDYPMVAPNYAALRSTFAKSIGLGKKPEPEPAAPVKRGSRAKKTAA